MWMSLLYVSLVNSAFWVILHIFSPTGFSSECQIANPDQDPNCLQRSSAYDEIRHWQAQLKDLLNAKVIALISPGLAEIEKAIYLIQLQKTKIR